MVDLGGCHLLAEQLAVDAPSMTREKAPPGLVPLAVVPALVAVASLSVVLAPLSGLSPFALAAVPLAVPTLTTASGLRVFDELRAAWLGADPTHQPVLLGAAAAAFRPPIPRAATPCRKNPSRNL